MRDNETGRLSAEIRPDGSMKTHTMDHMEGSSAAVLPQGGVFSRVQTTDGTLGGLDQDTIVSGPSIPGDAMKLSQAVAAGFIIENPDGSYSTPGGSRTALVKKTTLESPEEPTEAPLESEPIQDLVVESITSEESLATLVDQVSPNDQINGLNQLVDNGAVSDELVGQVASNLGVDPSAVHGQIGSIVSEFETQARATINKSGVDSEAVIEWARVHAADELRDAMMAQGQKRTTAGYADIAKSYVERLDTIDPSAILNAELKDGLKARRDDGGRIILTTPSGSSMEWRSAVRSGLVSIA